MPNPYALTLMLLIATIFVALIFLREDENRAAEQNAMDSRRCAAGMILTHALSATQAQRLCAESARVRSGQ